MLHMRVIIAVFVTMQNWTNAQGIRPLVVKKNSFYASRYKITKMAKFYCAIKRYLLSSDRIYESSTLKHQGIPILFVQVVVKDFSVNFIQNKKKNFLCIDWNFFLCIWTESSYYNNALVRPNFLYLKSWSTYFMHINNQNII